MKPRGRQAPRGRSRPAAVQVLATRPDSASEGEPPDSAFDATPGSSSATSTSRSEPGPDPVLAGSGLISSPPASATVTAAVVRMISCSRWSPVRLISASEKRCWENGQASITPSGVRPSARR